jgi:tetratricopeptide (TPR) repeat protein
VNEYRNDLATACVNRGDAQQGLQNPEMLRAAIASYDEAIGLRRELPLEVNEYRNALATAYMNRGNAQQGLQNPEMLRAAIASYDEAIGLRRELPLEVNKYRNDLAGAYMNRGNVQQGLQNPEMLRAAIASYDEAIGLLRELPLEVNKYRNALASAYMNRGVAQQGLQNPEMLREAIASFDEAIGLRLELPLEVNEYRNALASAYVNRGFVHDSWNETHAMKQARDSYGAGIRLLESVADTIPRSIEISLGAAAGLTGNLMREAENAPSAEAADYFEAATEAADEALKAARKWRARDIYWFDDRFERLFVAGGQAYAAGEPQFLGEFLLENLDPVNPGAFPESPLMHEFAQRSLVLANWKLRQKWETTPLSETGKRGRLAGWIVGLEDAGRDLEALRLRYLGSGYEAASLQARHYEEAGDIERALQTLQACGEKQPLDVRVVVRIAELFASRSLVEEALESFLEAGGLLPRILPREASTQDVAYAVECAIGIARKATAALVQPFPDPDSPDAIPTLNGQFDRAHAWLGLFKAPFVGSLAVAGARVDDLSEELARQRDEFLASDREGLKAAFMRREAGLREASRIQIDVLVGGISKAWGVSADALRQSFGALSGHYAPQFDAVEDDTEETERLRAQMAGDLARELAKLAAEFSLSEMASARDEAARLLGPRAASLPEDQMKLIVGGIHLIGVPGLELFAGVAFGQAMELEIGRCALYPLRDELVHANMKIEFDADRHFLEGRLGELLNGLRPHLMLGEMVGLVGKVVYKRSDLERPVFTALDGHIGRVFANRAHFAAAHERRDQPRLMNRVLGIRNACAHPSERPQPSELVEAKDCLLGDDGFLPTWLDALGTR